MNDRTPTYAVRYELCQHSYTELPGVVGEYVKNRLIRVVAADTGKRMVHRTSHRKAPPVAEGAPSRAESKLQTRQALLEAALRLLIDKGLGSLSLREVAREAGVVPTAFYRHFDSIDELGLSLVDEAFRTLRRMMRVAREAPLPHDELVRRSVETFAHYVEAHASYFRFVVRERFGGSAAVSLSIRNEIRLLESELATDLARFSPLDRWKVTDLQMLANLLVTVMVSMVERVLEVRSSGAALREVFELAEQQVSLVLAGAREFK